MSKTSHIRFEELEDSDLVKLYQETSDRKIVGVLYHRYSHLVYGVCLKYIKVRDIAQEAVIGIFERVLTDLEISNVFVFKAWLYTVTKNYCLMYLRSMRRDENRIQRIAAENRQDVSGTDEVMESEQPDDELYNAVSQLSEDQQTCIRLFYLECNSYKQVCTKTGYSFRQVKTSLQNGRKNLKKILIQSYDNK